MAHWIKAPRGFCGVPKPEEDAPASWRGHSHVCGGDPFFYNFQVVGSCLMPQNLTPVSPGLIHLPRNSSLETRNKDYSVNPTAPCREAISKFFYFLSSRTFALKSLGFCFLSDSVHRAAVWCPKATKKETINGEGSAQANLLKRHKGRAAKDSKAKKQSSH